MRYRVAQIVQHELRIDSHLNILLQSKYYNLYTKWQADWPKFKLDSTIRMSTTIKLVHDQLHAEGRARLEILVGHNEDDANAYWENLEDEEAFNIANMMEG